MAGKPKSLKDLDLKVSDLKDYFNNELGKFREEIVKVKTPTSEADGDDERVGKLLNRFDLFRAAVENRLGELESQICALRKDTKTALYQLDRYVQFSNRGKILLLGIKEDSDKTLLNDIVNIFKSKLHITIDNGEVYSCYRIGKKLADKNRPVCVEFCSVAKRNEVFGSKRSLKGSGVVMTDVLSPSRYHVYKLARQKYGKDCWTLNGRIGIKIRGNVRYVTSAEQFHTATGTIDNDGASDSVLATPVGGASLLVSN